MSGQDGGDAVPHDCDEVASLLRRARECDYLELLGLQGTPQPHEVTQAAQAARDVLAAARQEGRHAAAQLNEIDSCLDDAEAVLTDPARAAAYTAH